MAPRKRIVRTIRSVNCEQVVARRVSGVPCDFCGVEEDDELKFGNLYMIGDIAAHYFCVLLSSGAEQHGDDDEGLLGFLYKDILKEYNRGQKNCCASKECRRKGATLGCAKKSCKKQYHLPCARRNEAICLFYDKFEVFCKHHCQKQEVPPKVIRARQEQRRKQDGADCQICYGPVGPSPSYDTFWPPCCGPEKDEWFHRDCLANLALHAGLYHLKCPLCNNKDQFNRAVEQCGYYIPDRDASWELEGNAFADPAPSCNVEDCPNKTRDDDTGDWRLVVCVACGGQEVHEGCAVTLPHRCHVCRRPTADMGLDPLPTVREIERGVEQPRLMTTRMSLRRTMSKETLQNSKLFLERNKRMSSFKVEREDIIKTEPAPHLDQPTPTKLILDSLANKKNLFDLQDSEVDEITKTIKDKLNKPAPYSKKKENIREIIEYIFDEFQPRHEVSPPDLKAAGPSRASSPTFTEPMIDPNNIKDEFSTPVKRNERKHFFVSPSRSHPYRRVNSPEQKKHNLLKALERIEALANGKKTHVNVVSNTTEYNGEVNNHAKSSNDDLVEGSCRVNVPNAENTDATSTFNSPKQKEQNLLQALQRIEAIGKITQVNVVSNLQSIDEINTPNIDASSSNYDLMEATCQVNATNVENTATFTNEKESNNAMDTSVANSDSLINSATNLNTSNKRDENASLNTEHEDTNPDLKNTENENDVAKTLAERVKAARDSIFKKPYERTHGNKSVETLPNKATETKSKDTVEEQNENNKDKSTKTRRKRKHSKDLKTKEDDTEVIETANPANRCKRKILCVQEENDRNTKCPKVTPVKINIRSKVPEIITDPATNDSNREETVEQSKDNTEEVVEQTNPIKDTIDDTHFKKTDDIELKADEDRDQNRCRYNHKHDTPEDTSKRISTPIDFAKTAALQKEIEARAYNIALERELLKTKDNDRKEKKKHKRKGETVELSIAKKKGHKMNKLKIRLQLNFSSDKSKKNRKIKEIVLDDSDIECDVKTDGKMKQTFIQNYFTVKPR